VTATWGTSGRITAVGLGPAGLDLVTPAALAVVRDALAAGRPVFFRTGRHPSASELIASDAGAGVATFDDRYELAPTFEEVYESIVATLLAEAPGGVVYAVPGSPLVAEITVDLLRSRAADAAVELEVVPGLSFCDLAWARLGVDPIAAGVRLVDGGAFSGQAAGDHGPLLVAQCWSNAVLSDVKLSITEPAASQRAIILHHLGLADEQVIEVAWEDLDRTLEADHLTSVFIEELAAPVAADLVRLAETVARLRRECPWDREQTHQSLARHLLEETYEAIEAIEGLGADAAEASAEQVAHLEEELGDLLCQVVFHSTLAREEGWFELSDVAQVITEKLVTRHPHVFGDTVAATAADVMTNWERIKRHEKGRASLLDGVPAAMPALARAGTIERKLASAGLGWDNTGGGPDDGAGTGDGPDGAATGRELTEAGAEATGGDVTEAGDALLVLARAVAHSGVDPEAALRVALDRLDARVREMERAAAAQGTDLTGLPPATRAAWFAGGVSVHE
jgi:tetrapyrrole methylase family protein/MazG family protein